MVRKFSRSLAERTLLPFVSVNWGLRLRAEERRDQQERERQNFEHDFPYNPRAVGMHRERPCTRSEKFA
jgi:hypothetical protein